MMKSNKKPLIMQSTPYQKENTPVPRESHTGDRHALMLGSCRNHFPFLLLVCNKTLEFHQHRTAKSCSCRRPKGFFCPDLRFAHCTQHIQCVLLSDIHSPLPHNWNTALGLAWEKQAVKSHLSKVFCPTGISHSAGIYPKPCSHKNDFPIWTDLLQAQVLLNNIF